MNLLEKLCKDEPHDVQIKIKAAYWQGCSEGILFGQSPASKIERQEDNVVYLRSSIPDP